jgi:hypothetical protein
MPRHYKNQTNRKLKESDRIRCIYGDVIKIPGIHKNTKPIMHREQKKNKRTKMEAKKNQQQKGSTDTGPDQTRANSPNTECESVTAESSPTMQTPNQITSHMPAAVFFPLSFPVYRTSEQHQVSIQ